VFICSFGVLTFTQQSSGGYPLPQNFLNGFVVTLAVARGYVALKPLAGSLCPCICYCCCRAVINS